MDQHKNFATSLVATAPSPATSGTSLVVTGGEGTRFPAVPFNATICPSNADPTPANAEIVRVTGISTDTLTITRAQESSSARTVVVGDRIFAGTTAKTLTDVEALIAVRRVIHGAVGASITTGAVGATKYMLRPDAGANPSTATTVSNAAVGSALFRLVGADYAITGLTTTLVLRGMVGTTSTAPTVTYTFALVPFTISTSTTAPGAAVGNSAVVTTPGASAFSFTDSAAFTIPSDAVYGITVSPSGTPAGNVMAEAQLLLYHV
jgi:hypothetical protein